MKTTKLLKKTPDCKQLCRIEQNKKHLYCDARCWNLTASTVKTPLNQMTYLTASPEGAVAIPCPFSG
jgi:hypothetical protein